MHETCTFKLQKKTRQMALTMEHELVKHTGHRL